jgi:hypothetical protein
MLQEQLIKEIEQIPEDKLSELYDLIHYFRLGLLHERQAGETPASRPIGLAKGSFQIPSSFFDPLPDEMLDAFEGK